jgi:hypothetical protein
MDYIKNYYDLPFLKPGMKLEMDGKKCTALKEKNGHLQVKFENGSEGPIHPTWETVYFDDKGKILKDFREPKTNVPKASQETNSSPLADLESGKRILLTDNLKLHSISENNWDDNKLIAVVCNFTFFNLYADVYVAVDNLKEDNPKYAMIESEEEIHDSLKASLIK